MSKITNTGNRQVSFVMLFTVLLHYWGILVDTWTHGQAKERVAAAQALIRRIEEASAAEGAPSGDGESDGGLLWYCLLLFVDSPATVRLTVLYVVVSLWLPSSPSSMLLLLLLPPTWFCCKTSVLRVRA